MKKSKKNNPEQKTNMAWNLKTEMGSAFDPVLELKEMNRQKSQPVKSKQK